MTVTGRDDTDDADRGADRSAMPVQRDPWGRRLDFACGECGTRWAIGAYDDNGPGPRNLRHCPYCGARDPRRLPTTPAGVAEAQSHIESARADIAQLHDAEDNAMAAGTLAFALDVLDQAREYLAEYADRDDN